MGAAPLPSSVRCGGGGRGSGRLPLLLKAPVAAERRPWGAGGPLGSEERCAEDLRCSPGSGLSRLRALDPRAEAVVLQGALPALPAGSSSSSFSRTRRAFPPTSCSCASPHQGLQNAVLPPGHFELVSASILCCNASFFMCWVHSVLSVTSSSGFGISAFKVYYWDS